MASPQPAPDLNIPPSKNTVSVSIINTTCFVKNVPPSYFMQPAVPGFDTLNAPCYSFLIKHDNPAAKSKYDTLLFDLGIRKDWENSPKKVLQGTDLGLALEIEKSVVDILRDNGEDPADVGAIIWSHYHLDHTGDPSTFPPSTDLIVGPGFKDHLIPAYPTNPDGLVHESAWAGRTLREIAFAPPSEPGAQLLHIGGFRAYDFFGDGSFYLLDSPGHATGHLCALARTRAAPPEFLVLGGDVAHHAGEFRPSAYVPLPPQIRPDPMLPPFHARRSDSGGSTAAAAAAAAVASFCPGALFTAVHPEASATTPFMHPEAELHDDAAEVLVSVRKWIDFDAHDNVFSIIAHDMSLFDVVDFYPAGANDWRAKGWKEEGRWRFLRDFAPAKGLIRDDLGEKSA